jgi:streptogramin lyase
MGGDGTGSLGYVTPSGVVKEITTGFTNSPPEIEAFAPGPDGNIWFLDTGSPNYSVGHVAVKGGSYTLSESDVGVNGSDVLAAITAGPDGNMWFTADTEIGKIALPSGTVTEIAAGTHGLQSNGDPDEIMPGPDGNLWFDDQYSGDPSVGVLVPSTMAVHEFSLKTSSTPWTMAFGSDGNLYVAQTGLVAQFTTAGAENDFPTPSMTTGMDGDQLVQGPDGNLYYNDSGTKVAVQVNLNRKPAVMTGAATAITTSGATIAGTVTPLSADTSVSVAYGTTSALGSSVSAGVLSASTSTSSISARLTGLVPATTIFYEVVASNANGTVHGAMQSFTTLKSPPPATSVVTASFGNQRLSLTTSSPLVCLASTAQLPVTFTSVRVSSHDALSSTGVSFRIDKGVKHQRRKKQRKHGKRTTVTVTTYVSNATAHRVPATVDLSLKGLGHGTHMLTVVAGYSETVGSGRKRQKESKTKTLKAPFRVC